MLTETVKYSKPGKIAKRIEADYLRRGLGPGDRYFSAAEASDIFGVSQGTADRAMRLLAKTKKLVRKPRGGTFIGPNVTPIKHKVTVKAVYVLYPAGIENSIYFGQFSKAIYESFDNVAIQYISIPKKNGFSYFCTVIDEAVSNGSLVGVVCLSATRDIYEYLYRHNVNTVVLGTLYSDQRFFTSIDRNATQSAQLLVKHLVSSGRKRLLVLLKYVGRAGSDEFLDAINETAHDEGLASGDVKVRICNDNTEETIARVTELFLSGETPDGIIVDGEYTLDIAERVCAKMDMQIGKDVEIVYESGALLLAKPKKYVHTQTQEDLRVIIDKAVRSLKSATEGKPAPAEHISVPVELAGIKSQ